jgi:hypothetical protein
MSIMNLRTKWSFFAFVAVIIIVTSAVTSATSSPTVLALKKGSARSGSSTTSDVASSSQNQIKGLKILQIHTSPSTVIAGSTFNIRAVVVNNSTATITFPNGTCNSPVSVDFNKNVITENVGTASCAGSTPEVTLKPGDKSKISSPDLSGVAYKAVTPGSTNATITFNYGVQGTTAVPSASNTITRVYTFTVQASSRNGALQAGSQPSSATNIPIFNPTPQSTVSPSGSHSGDATSNTTATSPSNSPTKATGSRSLLTIKYPDKNTVVPAGTFIAVSGTSAPSNTTRTNCNVGVQLNQNGFVRATPQGPKGAADYTKWTAITASPTKQGVNEIEAQLLCFPPGNLSTPNLTKHLVHNVTALQVVGMPSASQPSPSSPPSPSSKHSALLPKTGPTVQGSRPLVPLIPGH